MVRKGERKMIGEVYEINSEGNVWLKERGPVRLVKYSQQVCCVKAASLVMVNYKLQA